jgi:CheY-like chemotaxis protein
VKRLLLVEDQAKDALNAANVAESVGFDHVEACCTIRGAMASLEKGVKGEGPIPDAIVLDLDLGVESGFELLRYWYATPALTQIPLMVWSIVEEQRKICELFKVKAFVSKWEGLDAFRQGLMLLQAPAKADSDA